MNATVQRYIHYLGWLLSLAAMAYLVYRLVNYPQYDELGVWVGQATCGDWVALGVAIVLIPLQLFIEVLRWQYTLRGWKTISLRESWSEVMVGLLAGFLTPYRSGDLPARLVACGLDISKEEYAARWREWLKDLRKWWAVIGYTALRYLVWGIQLWCVFWSVGIAIPLPQAIVSIALYYVVVSIMPALPAADVPLKGGWAVLIFGQYTENIAAIVLAVSIIWIFNTIIPVLFAGIRKILYLCTRKND